MIVCETISDIKKQLALCENKKIAFVATMGNLHQGHLALVKRAQELADKVVVSIFINPLQFNQNSDFNCYPRSLDNDKKLLEKINLDFLFTPNNDDLYPQGQSEICKVVVPRLSDVLEGEKRPGHFTGVTTIVNKLFNIVQPDIALFGKKDFQQLLLVRRMVNDLNMPIKIEAVATSRHENGLAMSSRNNRLSRQQQQQASEIYAVLNNLNAQLKQGNTNYSELQKGAFKHLVEKGFKPEYIEIRRCEDLQHILPTDSDCVILVAAWLADVRLIDNLTVQLGVK